MSQSDEEGIPQPPTFNPHQDLPQDFEVRLMKGLVKRLLQRIENPQVEVTVAEMELIRKLSESNSVSFSSIKRGDFGQTAQRIAEEFPFDEGGNVVSMGGR
jgi:hypothetical protein